MHRCLRIPEIFLAILDRLEVDGDQTVWLLYGSMRPEGGGYYVYPARKPECLALALTCKQFLEPALDALWESLPSIRPLLAIVLAASHVDLSDEIERLKTRRLQQVDIDRVACYARRIRALRVDAEDMTSSICRILSTNTPSSSRPLFPNLVCLRWTFQDLVKTSPYITLFAGPSLQALTLLPVTWTSSIDEFVFHGLSTFAAYCPCLEYVKLDNDHCTDEDTGRETALVLSVFPSLTTADIATSVSPHALFCLAEMPLLRSLMISFSETDAAWMSVPPTGPSFPSLQEVSLTLGAVSDYTEFFNSFHGRRDIRKIRLLSSLYPTASELDNLVQSVRDACCPTTLTVFTLVTGLEDDLFDEPPMPHLTVCNSTFSPLFSFRQMEIFDVILCDAELDDRLLAGMANAWPNLRKLTLITCSSERPSQLSLNGLYPFAKNCHQLEFLGLQLSSLDVDVGVLRKRDWDKPSTKTQISLYGSMDDSLEQDIVSYLTDLFPASDKDVQWPRQVRPMTPL